MNQESRHDATAIPAGPIRVYDLLPLEMLALDSYIR